MVSSEVVRLGDFVFELRSRDQVEEKCREKNIDMRDRRDVPGYAGDVPGHAGDVP